MPRTPWHRLQPQAPAVARALLDDRGGPVQPPIRAEIFGPQRFAQHGRSLGLTHHATRAGLRKAAFFPRLADNVRTLHAAHRYIGGQAAAGYDVSPAAEWLLDNFHLIASQLEQIHLDLPRSAVRALPVLQDPPLAGLPRIYGVAWAYVAHTDGAFDEDLLVHFLGAYQDSRALNLAEMWALPTTLRVLLIENLRRLAEREAAQMAAREVANLCCDRVLALGPDAGVSAQAVLLDALAAWLATLQRRGVQAAFLARMAQRLQDRPVAPAVRQWLALALPDATSVLAQQGADQAADNLSMSNAVTSLRAVGDADWSDLVARASALMRRMLATPLFAAEHPGTRDQTLHAIERLARRCACSEGAVAEALLARMRSTRLADGCGADAADAATAGHWLQGAGRDTLAADLGLHEPLRRSLRALRPHTVLPAYLAAWLLGTLALAAVALQASDLGLAPAGLAGALGLLWLLLPASEASVAVVNRLVSEWVRPTPLPRLALAAGIPVDQRVMVVIPTMASDGAALRATAHRLHLHHLANPERHAQFALLTDWTDADQAQAPGDTPLLDAAAAAIDTLNALHPAEPGAAPRFVLLHRPRQWCETEQRWIGWERKRGKLLQLLAALATGTSDAFLPLGERARIAPGTRHLLTLDSDTALPPGRLRALVGVAAHPQNQPRLGPGGRHVARGYGILQPHVLTPLPARREITPFHWLFAGHSGIDPYSAASSEGYQDLFGEGSFSGKGLLQVQAVHAVLGASLPEGRVLSHDLLEGSLARCAAVTDISVVEDAPFQADVASARMHRWMRGDWQLLPFLFHPVRWPLRAVHRWKMLDNLRRSLVAPASLALLMLALAGQGLAPGAALAVVLAAYTAGPLMGALAGLLTGSRGAARRHFYTGAGIDLLRVLCTGVWSLWQLGAQAWLSADAVLRTAWRMAVSRRHLLQWTPFAAVQAGTRGQWRPLLRRHLAEPLLALALLGVLWAVLWAVDGGLTAWAIGLALLWATSPLANGWASRPLHAQDRAPLSPAQRSHLAGIARDTWRLFERCVGPDDRHLPPDNLQVLPHDLVAHRTSPTNIGLYLLSAACARQFGWIGTQDLLDRLEATLATLAMLPRHRGHFLNWYDTRTGAALLPAYVSTVDSGNFSGHLLAVAQACRALALAPHDDRAARQALAASHSRLAAPHAVRPGEPLAGPAMTALLARADPLADGLADPAAFARALAAAGAEQAADPHAVAMPLPPAAPLPEHRDAWLLADHLATLCTAARDQQAQVAEAAPQQSTGALTCTHTCTHTHDRLLAVAAACEALAWAADFRFLYHRRRHLFHIGWRVAEQQLDAGFYDLLASESRLASLLAIAKGDVPVSHWAALGRPFFAAGTQVGLRSWSGSMFEYLMPSLVLDEPPQSVLCAATAAALGQQRAFGAAHHVPWGASESAHAGRDHTLAYQYAPHGVPQLALRRTPPDELVIAPYASVLAAQVAPQVAQHNLLALQALGARGRYGLIEALDFSTHPPHAGPSAVPVATYMAHHQGMSIVALANVLLDGVARRWGMGDAHVQAVASLLHERLPRKVPPLPAPPRPRPLPAAMSRSGGGPREVLPGLAAVEPTQLLSNGRYQVALRANGAGSSRWAGQGITRWRDDALADACGQVVYLRRGSDPQAQAVSITQHPAPDPAAHYSSQFHADRLLLQASWPGLRSVMTVWVSPEDDIEFRQVELHNLGDRTLELELISAFEPTLADPRADEAHPAFSSLFLGAVWKAGQQALVFERRPRLDGEPALHMAHFLAEGDPQVVELRLQADRQDWAGRNRAASHPRARLQAPPDGPMADEATGDAPGGIALDTGLDPVCALGLRLRIAPRSQLRVVFGTAASDDATVLHAVVDKYRQASHVQRASLMSATMSDVRWRAWQLSAEAWADIQTLATALVFNLARPQQAAAGEVCDRSLLWRFGLSGERPLLLVTAAAPQGLGLLRTLAQALRVWAWGGLACDLVVVNAEAASYQTGLHADLLALRDHLAAEQAAIGAGGRVALHVLRAEDLSADEVSTLHHLARLRLDADGRPLQHHVQAWRDLHEAALEARHAVSTVALRPAATGDAAPTAAQGDFVDAGGAFRFSVGARQRPARPWVNVLANPAFGSLLSEAGGGFTWAGNSRLHQLTAWSNDPVADPPSEWLLIQDEASRDTWSATPTAWAADLAYTVTHGQGETRVRHRHGDLEVLASWCVDAQLPVRQLQLRLVNHGPQPRALRIVSVTDWMLGAGRADRATTFSRMRELRGGGAAGLLLSCTQRERAGGFGNGTAFVATEAGDDPDWTCDRRECVDARGRPVLPDHFGQHSGSGLDPCAALSLRLRLPAGGSAERVILLGHAESPQAARDLAVRALAVPPAQRADAVRQRWDALLGATEVHTPDPLFDVLVNRWLLYQAVSCRLWAKAGFYQAGGATGFRDQLQDSLALAWAAPQLLREQILRCASRQFAEGDVQHWWHAPNGAGVRTHVSDDLLWLPHALLHHLRAGGDAALLEQQVPFIEGTVIADGAEDAYDTPRTSHLTASVYEHAARTIDHSLRTGAHGLPLMGSGDWNDGMNRVGHGGRGESVWLGWFACQLVAGFAPLARARGDSERAQRWDDAAAGWQGALLGAAWDGHWYLRAFFDDGQPLGASANPEARIDLIAQAWAVLSGVAPPQRQREALAAVQAHLADGEAGLLRLLDPPLAQAEPNAGYIQAYPPGVRENGGQYAHAAVWALMAQAKWATGAQGTADDRDRVYRWFTWLSPAHRSADPVQGPRYGLEPYAMAGDICSAPPHTGRGGWSWYTGSAAWLHRAAVESVFGLHIGAQVLHVSPCLPSHWPGAELTLRRDGRRMHFVLQRMPLPLSTDGPPPQGGAWLAPGQPLAWTDLPADSRFVIPLGM